ncbi:MAG: PH domain-containing protein, partial [Phycisphaerae bacterium]|nr:PH domain-containing protein [Phycisphaerae bacterium]
VVIVLATVVCATAAETAGVSWSGAVVQLGAMLIVARVVQVGLDWGSRLYVLTDRRVLRRRGVLSPTVYSGELRKLPRIELASSIWQRMCGVGTVTFSARLDGTHDAAWVMVARAREVHALVLETKQRYGK